MFWYICRLLQLLSGSIGDVSGTAAAIHKCLVCDKPVNPFALLGDSPTKGNQTYGYDKVAEFNRSRPATSGAVLSSTRPAGDVRISAEVNILRNSVEVLPMIAQAVSWLKVHRIRIVIAYRKISVNQQVVTRCEVVSSIRNVSALQLAVGLGRRMLKTHDKQHSYHCILLSFYNIYNMMKLGSVLCTPTMRVL